MKSVFTMRMFFSLIAALVTSALATTAWAQQIESEMKPYIVTVDDEGNEVFAVASEAEPGDIIEYRVTYTNNGDDAVHGLVVTGPIPNQTEYVSSSNVANAKSSFMVSIDNGSSWDSVPVKRMRTRDDGTEYEVIIAASEYDKVRWNVEDRLAAGAQQEFKYRVKVSE